MSGVFDDLAGLLPGAWNPWTAIPAPVPYAMFGRGSRRPFSWYLQGETRVAVSNVGDIERWLLGCEYVDDRVLFGKEDHWMHPGEFEVLRMGDCDDHALWAWRKMVDLGLEAWLLAGRWSEDPDDAHIWVNVHLDGREHVFESTSKVLGEALHPLDRVKAKYRPFFAVDGRLRTRAYAGAAKEVFDWGGEL